MLRVRIALATHVVVGLCVAGACTSSGDADRAASVPTGSTSIGTTSPSVDTGTTTGSTGSATAPPDAVVPRCYAAMTDAPGRIGVLLAGGFDNSGPPGAFLPEVWSFALRGDWTYVTRWEAEVGELMAYDRETDRAVYIDISGAAMTLDPDDARWEEVEAPGADLHGARVVYDSQSDLIIVFGGDAFTPTPFDTTWAIDVETETWTEMRPATRPAARTYFAMAYDEATDRVVVFGGFSGTAELGDTWTYDVDTDTWELVSSGGGPGARGYAAMADDPTSDRVVLFGGVRGASEEPLGDAWSFDLGTGEWTQLQSASAPSPRAWHAMATDSETDGIVLFGGGPTRSECTAETWILDPRDGTWTQIGGDR
jgi:hypothetical protein